MSALSTRHKIRAVLQRHPDLFDDVSKGDWFMGEWLLHDGAPAIVAHVERLALVAVNRGKRYGINTLIEVTRWETGHDEDSGEFKVNNDIAPYVSRLLMVSYPVLQGYFYTRSHRHAA